MIEGGLGGIQVISIVKQSILFDKSKSGVRNFIFYLLFAYGENVIFDVSYTARI